MATSAQIVQFLLSPITASGITLSGGQAFFFAAGTSTPKTIWLDRNRTTEAANPYTLNDGTAQLYADGIYRVVIKDSNGVVRYDRDYLNFADNGADLTDISSRLIKNVSEYASLAAAVAAIGNTPMTLAFSTAQNLSADLVTPSTLELLPLNGAVINQGSYNVTYGGSTARWPKCQIFSGTGWVALTGSDQFQAEWVGVVGDDQSGSGGGNSLNLQRIINGAIATPGACKTVVYQAGTYHFANGILINNPANQNLARGFKFVGQGKENPNQGSGTLLRSNVVGKFITLGETDGQPDDIDAYTGPQGFYVKDIQIRSFLAGTDKTASYGIFDYYAGHVCLDNVDLTGFGTGFYGIRSDINSWRNVGIINNGIGVYAAARSNQFTIHHGLFITNDKDYVLIDPVDVRFNACQFVGSGTAGGYAAEIINTVDGSANPHGLGNLVAYNDCWFENYQRNVGVHSCVYVHSTHATKAMTRGIVFNNPYFAGNYPWTSYLVRNEMAHIVINNPVVRVGLKALVYSDSTSLNDGSVTITGNLAFESGLAESIVKEANGTGTTNIMIFGDTEYHPQLKSSAGRLYLRRYPENGNRDFYIGSNGDGQFDVVFPANTVSNPTRLSLQRRIVHGIAAPTTGTWQQGDKVLNRSPVAGGNEGWVCVTDGTPGTWKSYGNIAA